MNTDKKLTDEEIFAEHLNMDLNPQSNQNILSKNNIIEKTISKTINDNLDYLNVNINELPCSRFYPYGMSLKVRAATVKEIQAFSMVDDSGLMTSIPDIIDKMNYMLSSCIRVTFNNGSTGTFLDIMDPDRIYLIFLIRELTFQEGNKLSNKAKCSCGIEHDIELRRANFRFYEPNPKFEKFFKPANGCYTFKDKGGSISHFSTPKIGIQKSFTEYIDKSRLEGKELNMAFIKILPFFLTGVTTIDSDGIEAKLKEFEEIDMKKFNFLNSIVDSMKFGIEKVVKTCECGKEVHTDNTFPKKPSTLFINDNGFDDYIEE